VKKAEFLFPAIGNHHDVYKSAPAFKYFEQLAQANGIENVYPVKQPYDSSKAEFLIES